MSSGEAPAGAGPGRTGEPICWARLQPQLLRHLLAILAHHHRALVEVHLVGHQHAGQPLLWRQHLLDPLEPGAARLKRVRPRHVVDENDGGTTLPKKGTAKTANDEPVCRTRMVRPAAARRTSWASARARAQVRSRTFQKPGSISVNRSCPPVSKMCSSTLMSVSGIGTCLETNSTPHVIWYVLGKRWPEELNIWTSDVLPTAGSPACPEAAQAR